mmetsp:Transcript_37166/g.109655  ORF Transcript_37166/g.109655 Transcript_37166/m.109655 type:complete len:137 (-) Transcript_37166:1286-1696(-)
MAKYGVPMLEKLLLQYCPRDGSSAGMRAFLQDYLPSLRASNVQLEIETLQRQRRHPKAVGMYRNGISKPIDVKNLSAAEIAEHIMWMRNSHGRGQDYKVTGRRHLSRNPTIQGMWTVDTFARLAHRIAESQSSRKE